MPALMFALMTTLRFSTKHCWDMPSLTLEQEDSPFSGPGMEGSLCVRHYILQHTEGGCWKRPREVALFSEANTTDSAGN